MDCTRCRAAVEKAGRYCTGCGLDFGEDAEQRLSAYFALKAEVEQVRSLQADASGGLARISRSLAEFGSLIAQDIARLAGAAPAGDVRQQAVEPPRAAPAETTAQAAPHRIPQREREQERRSSELELHLGQRWALIAGILTMVFGVGYFLKYSFDQGWVTPAGRVAAAYVWGMVFLVAGDRFRKRPFEAFGLSLIGGGIAVLYFAAFAAFQIYHLFGQASSFSIMALITVLAGTLAVRYDTKWLAVLGLVGGFLTPVLLSTGQDNQIALMTYLTILNLGLLGIAFHKKWDLLNALGFLFTYLVYTGWFVSHYTVQKFWPAVLFLNLFFLIYSIAPFAYQFVRRGAEAFRGVAILVPNAFIAFGYSYGMIAGEFSLPWVSIVSALYAAVFLALATLLYRTGRQEQEAFIVLLAKAMLFLVITVPLIFSKHWITIFWAAQAIALLWTGLRLERRGLAAGAFGLFAIAVLKFLTYDLEVLFRFNVWTFAFADDSPGRFLERTATSLVLLVTLARAGVLAGRAPRAAVFTAVKDAAVLFAAATILLFIMLNLELGGLFHDHAPEARFAAFSVLWTVFSVALMIAGFRKNSALVRKVSFGLFLATVLKVFLIDMANVSTPYRIISFIILGLVLMGTSYLYYRYKDRIVSSLAESGGRERRP